MDSSFVTYFLAPLLRPLVTNAPPDYWRGRRNDMMTFDTAVGAAATLGFSVALLRLVAYTLKQHSELQNGKDDDDDDDDDDNDNDDDDNDGAKEGKGKKHKVISFLQALLLRSLFLNFLPKDSDGNRSHTGDSYFNQVHDRFEIDDNTEEQKIYNGSCHCHSIQFTLKVEGRLKALDCTGKIRYPHIITDASHFQLINGSSCLHVYYVTLPSDAYTPNDIHLQKEKTWKHDITAAHAFCNRCGVHIFRAPDSRNTCLEINFNCLDIPPQCKEKGKGSNTLTISFYDSLTKLSAGTAISNQWKEDIEKVKQTENNDISSPFKENNEYIPSQSQTLHKHSMGMLSTSPVGTEASTLLSNSSQSFLAEPNRFDQESLSMDSSSHESASASAGTGTGTGAGAGTGTGAGAGAYGITNWAVGSSLRSPSMDIDTLRTSNHTMVRNGNGANHLAAESTIHTPILQHQLKYYMTRHLSKPKKEDI